MPALFPPGTAESFGTARRGTSERRARLLYLGVLSAAIAASVLFWVVIARGGSLEPPAPPAPTMATLDEIHTRLDSVAGARFELVGTTSPIAADSGPLGMARACQQQFGPGTRMCTTLEVLETTTLPMSSDYHSTSGWVRPVPVSIAATLDVDDNDLFVFTLEAGGRSDYSIRNCASWTQASGSGMVVQTTIGAGEGAVVNGSCNSTDVGAACCGPAQ